MSLPTHFKREHEKRVQKILKRRDEIKQQRQERARRLARQNRKLTPGQIILAKQYRADGFTVSEIADIIDASDTTVRRALNGHATL